MIKILILLSVNLFYCQSRNFIVCDDLNKLKVPFATIMFLNIDSTSKTSYANKSGMFAISDLKLITEINITVPGYESKSVNPNTINDTVFIRKRNIFLEEVVIKRHKNEETINIGYNKKTKKSKLCSSAGIETAVFIENEAKKERVITSLLLRMSNDDSYTIAVRIHFYETVLDSIYPGNELTENNIIYYLEKNTSKKIEIDLRSYNIILPRQGVFAAVEWLGAYDEKVSTFFDSKLYETCIDLNSSMLTPITFSRSRLKLKPWDNLSEQFKKSDNEYTLNYLNASIGINVYKD